MSENNGNKEGKVIAICPICGKKFRDGPDQRHATAKYLMPPQLPRMPIQVSLDKLICTTCGIDVYPLEALEELKKRLRGEGGKIVQAPANIKIVK